MASAETLTRSTSREPSSAPPRADSSEPHHSGDGSGASAGDSSRRRSRWEQSNDDSAADNSGGEGETGSRKRRTRWAEVEPRPDIALPDFMKNLAAEMDPEVHALNARLLDISRYLAPAGVGPPARRPPRGRALAVPRAHLQQPRRPHQHPRISCQGAPQPREAGDHLAAHPLQPHLQAALRLPPTQAPEEALHPHEGVPRLQFHRPHHWPSWQHAEAHGKGDWCQDCHQGEG